MIRVRCSSVKLETPIERTSPSCWSWTSARHASTYCPLRRVGPVDEVEVGALHAEALERAAHRRDRVVVRVVAAGDLAGDDDLVARQAGAAQRLADLGLVLVVHGRVEHPVAGLEGGDHRGRAVLAAQGIGAEADRGEGGAVVEVVRRDPGHVSNLGRVATQLPRPVGASHCHGPHRRPTTRRRAMRRIPATVSLIALAPLGVVGAVRRTGDGRDDVRRQGAHDRRRARRGDHRDAG